MIGRLVAAMFAAVLVLVGCGSSNSGVTRDTSCGTGTNGVLCVVVYAGDTQIQDAIGYYSPTTSLTGSTWRLDLSGYDCNPASPTCQPTAQYPATARHTPPPVDGKCIAVFYAAGRRQCTSRLATAYASSGGFGGLPTMPSATLAAHTWLCVSAQIARGHGWRNQFSRSAACYHHQTRRG